MGPRTRRKGIGECLLDGAENLVSQMCRQKPVRIKKYSSEYFLTGGNRRMTNTTTASDHFDETIASGILSQVIRENKVILGGASMGKGLRKVARYVIQSHLGKTRPEYYEYAGAADLNENIRSDPAEESFYIFDIGVVVSQFYQWRKNFPRVEPFYALKCNPDPVIIRSLAVLGANFDCASRTEIRLVQELTKDLPRKPEIIYANPCKARVHIIEAVCKGVTMVTFDNESEIAKCAGISKKIKLIMRIVTDDRGSQCRLSSKFGAHRHKWRPLMEAAKAAELEIIGVSFHVGSGCHDSSRYELALRDAREIFDIGTTDFGFNMHLLDIGGGFPGETHSIWNPAELDEEEEEEEDPKSNEGLYISDHPEEPEESGSIMFFSEIASKIRPLLDELFPESSGVRIISEPGRYFVAASGTLVASVVSARTNAVDHTFNPTHIDDREASSALDEISREDQKLLLRKRSMSLRDYSNSGDIVETIIEEMGEYSKLYAMKNLAQQESDAYNDHLDIFNEGYETAIDVLGVPDEDQVEKRINSVEGMHMNLVSDAASDGGDEPNALTSLAAAGEAAVCGVVIQAVADSSALLDDYAYYINDGVYGAFNNIMFDHATVRPRSLRNATKAPHHKKYLLKDENGFHSLQTVHADDDSDTESDNEGEDRKLYPSTLFGPTCDSMDVIARSVLLPKLKTGDWLYFQNMGAYTCAAASGFNGFAPTQKIYVCSVMPQYFGRIIAGPENDEEEKKEEE